MATYKQSERKQYATIKKKGKPEYPIGDKIHAEKALQFINKGGLSPDEKAQVRRRAAKFGVGTAKKSTKKP